MILSRARAVLLAAAVCACATPYEAPPPDAAESYANFLVGRLADLRDDHDAASERYYRALERSPGDPVLLQGALTSALATGDEPRARALARAARGREVPSARLVRGAEALAGGRWRAARDELDGVEGSDAEELVERVLLLWARTGEGRADDVLAQLGRAEGRSFAGLIAYQRAMVLDAAGRDSEAIVAYRGADQAGLFLPPAVARNAYLLARSGDRQGALALLREGDRASNPLLAHAAREIERGALAPERLSPADGAAIGLFGLAAIFQQQSDSTAALSTLTLATMLDPGLDAARVAVAEAQIYLGRSDHARRALAAIPDASPYAETAHLMTAWTLAQENRGEEAVALARVAAEANGASPRAWRTLGDIYRRLDRYGEAEPIYTHLIEMRGADAPDWRLYFARGVTRERLGDWPGAEADLRRALEIEHDQPEVLNYLGYTWIERGEHLQEAMTMIQQAVEIRPQSGAIVDSLGWAYFRLGDYERAVETLERAVELEPADAILNDHLGDAYWRVGRRLEARFQWRRALSLNPAPSDRDVIEAKVERGLAPAPGSRSANR